MSGKELQVLLFKIIEAKIGSNQRLAAVVQDFFGISLNSAYRKIRGDNSISVDEMVQLCAHFNVSMDRLFQSKREDRVIFNFRKEVSNLEDIHRYFVQTTAQLQQLREKNTAQLYYAARDLPLFFYFRYPHLAAFKIGVWLKDHLEGAPADMESLFDPARQDPALLEAARTLGEEYLKLPTVELWTLHTLDNTLAQVAYCRSLGLIDREQSARIYRDLEQVLNDKHESTVKNAKGDTDVPAVLYQTDFITLCNGAYVEGDTGSVTFVAFSGINFIQTDDAAFNGDFKHAFDLHKKAGVLLSGSAERQRTTFFNHLHKLIDREKQRSVLED